MHLKQISVPYWGHLPGPHESGETATSMFLWELHCGKV